MRQLSALDASFLYLETPSAPMHVAGLYLYDPSTAKRPVTFDEMLENTRRRLHLAPCFRRRLVRVPFDVDHPYWVEDPDFALERHFLRRTLPGPGT